jgi:hypothetical protein
MLSQADVRTTFPSRQQAHVGTRPLTALTNNGAIVAATVVHVHGVLVRK